MKYVFYIAHMACGHQKRYSDFIPSPPKNDEEYCYECRDYEQVNRVQEVAQEIDDIEEMV